MRLYVGPYEWRARGWRFGWRMPVGAVAALDLRPHAQQIDPGEGRPAARALFLVPDSVVLPAPYAQIASDPREALSPARRDLLRAAFGAQAGSSVRLDDLLWDLWTQHSDPDGARARPIMPDRGGRL